MNKRQRLKEACHSMACLNKIISDMKSVGLNPDDKTFGGALYGSFTGLMNIAEENLEFNDVSVENEVYSILIEVTMDNFMDVAEEVWDKYGVE